MEELIFASCSCIVSLIVLIVAAILVRKAMKRSKAAGSAAAGSVAAGTVSTLEKGAAIKRGGTFGIFSIDNPENITVTPEGYYRVNYVVGQHGSLSGGSVKALPKGLPNTAATLSYDVFIPDTFEWSKSVITIPGGKLAGLCVGTTERGCATGGRWQELAGSFRVMWREDGKAIGYWYAAVKGAEQSGNFLKEQGAGVQAVADATGSAGVNMWYKKGGGLQLKRGWNSISMTVNLGTPGRTDGSISLTVNGLTKKVSDVKWRDSPTVKISNVDLVSFAGGGDEKWAFKKPTYILYRNVTLTA